MHMFQYRYYSMACHAYVVTRAGITTAVSPEPARSPRGPSRPAVSSATRSPIPAPEPLREDGRFAHELLLPQFCDGFLNRSSTQYPLASAVIVYTIKVKSSILLTIKFNRIGN